jgi:hypothetical protein
LSLADVDASEKKQKSGFVTVGLSPVDPEEWDTNEGRFIVESHLIKLVSGQNGKTTNPVKMQVGFKINGQKRFDLKHRSGRISVDVYPVDSEGKHEMPKRRIINVEVGTNEVEFHLPPGKYNAGVLAALEKNAWVSENINFEVTGAFNKELVPDLIYKNHKLKDVEK